MQGYGILSVLTEVMAVDIAELSMHMSANKIMMQKDIAVMKLAMNTQDTLAETVVQELITEGIPTGIPVEYSTTGHLDITI